MIVRILLLLVGLSLLAHGGSGLLRAVEASAPVVVPAIETAAAVQLLLTALVLSFRRPARSRLAEDPVPAADEPVHRPSPEYRRLMLVNLPPYAALSALEDPPPLGSQSAVRSALAGVLPGLSISDAGVAQYHQQDHSIRLDVGSDADVVTATIDVTGLEARRALKHLLEQTGWRAYAPRLGRFLSVGELAVDD